MQLSTTQQQQIHDDGFVKIPGAIPRVMVDAALRAINHSLGEGMDPAKVVTFRSQSYCPEVQSTPVITDLFNRTPLFTLAESALGEGKVRPVGSGQIALRFPSPQDPPRRPGPHLDGMYSPHNGVEKGTVGNFTMLVGVFLSDVPRPDSGNFTVWPGSHRQYEKYFQEHGPDSFLEGTPRIDLPEPRQITAQAGDAVICHYQLGHGIAGNAAPHTRYAIFFRIKHPDHDSDRKARLADIWRDWIITRP